MLYNHAGTTVTCSSFFHKHLITQIVKKNKLPKLPAERIGLRKREETGNSS